MHEQQNALPNDLRNLLYRRPKNGWTSLDVHSQIYQLTKVIPILAHSHLAFLGAPVPRFFRLPLPRPQAKSGFSDKNMFPPTKSYFFLPLINRACSCAKNKLDVVTPGVVHFCLEDPTSIEISPGLDDTQVIEELSQRAG